MRTDPDPTTTGLPFRDFMTQWPTGVTVVTTDGGGPVGCTVNSLMSLSLDPPTLIVSLSIHSGTLAAIRGAGRFGVNVLCARQRDLCARFARGPQHDRFREVATRTVRGVPLLADAAAAMVCAVRDELTYADHVLVVGAPLWNTVDTANPALVLHQRNYHTLGHRRCP